MALTEPGTIVEMFNLRLLRSESEAFLMDLSGRTWSYANVALAAEVVGTHLDRLGLKAGEVVGLYMPNRVHWVAGSLGCWSRGCTVAAVNRSTPAASAMAALSVSGAPAVCVEYGDKALNAFSVPVVPVSLEDAVQERPEQGLADPSPDGDAAILFTSGTTGEPKAFISSHRRLVEGAHEQAQSYATDPRLRESVAPEGVAPIVSFTAFGHLAAYTSLAFALWTGRRLALVEKFSVEAAKTLVERYGLKALRLNPAAIYMLATADVDIDMSNVRYVYSGTAPLSASTRELFSERYGVPILQGYGQSETGPVALSRYEDVVTGREPPGSVGRVLDRVTVRIADSDNRPLSPGTEGEIQVRTDQIATPAEGSTLPVTVDGYVRTGDVGSMDPDGFLWVTGRLTEKMVVGGFNVFPAEIEDALRRSDLVRDVVVVALPDDRLGDRPVAGVVWRHKPCSDLLERFAREHLASYKVPRAWFDLEAVPLTDRGKVDRRVALSTARSVLAES